MTVGELGVRMSAREFGDWQAYERATGTLGQERDDMLAAMTAYYVVCALGAKKSRLDKMVPTWFRPLQSWQDTKAAFKAIFKAMGGEERSTSPD